MVYLSSTYLGRADCTVRAQRNRRTASKQR
ncbi:Uncharacterised protein [Vibrio cholerae]|nr:Uncharacterised protein [Vibrio cholerae]